MTQNEPLISFIIPVWNVPAEMLDECIASIRSLSLREDAREIIIVDDGSAQSPIEQRPQWLDDVLVVRQANQGVAAARNRGLLLATGRFVQFVDGDDCLFATPYEHVLDLLRFCRADVVMFSHTDGREGKMSYDYQGPMAGTELMRRHNIRGAAWGYVFRRELAGQLRFTPGVAYGEDEEFTALLLLRAEAVCITEAVAYRYRERASSATGNVSEERVQARLDDTFGVLQRLSLRRDAMPMEARTALQRRIAQLTMDYIYNVIRLTHSSPELERRVEELRGVGLFPLPARDYTAKYKWFRRIANTQLGRRMLLAVI